MENEKNIVELKQGQVIVDKDKLDTILSKLNALEKIQADAGKPKILSKVKEHTTKLLRYVDKYFIGFSKPNWTKRIDGQIIEYTEVLLWSGKLDKENNPEGIKKQVVYLDFLKDSERIECKIIEKKINLKVENKGTIELKKVNYEKYNTENTGLFVEAVVETPELIFTVTLPEGGELTVNELATNI